jgi:dihydrolipoamide dehydrogenase
VPGEKVFVVVGRVPNAKGLGLEIAGVKPDAKGFVPVDAHCRTNVPNIYAIGDMTGQPMLAHKATCEGLIAAEMIAGHKVVSRSDCVIPSVVYTEPELVSVGMIEQEVQAKGIDYINGRFPFSALGRSLASGSMEGSVKVIAEAKGHRIIGINISGAMVSDLSGECVLIVQNGYTLEEVASIVHAHPTFGEGISEACEAALGRAIHVLNRR